MMKNRLKTHFDSDLFDTGQSGKIIDVISNTVSSYKYDQYRSYPAGKKDAWERYFLIRLSQLLENDEWMFSCRTPHNIPYLLGSRLSKWDHDHFGIEMANISVLLSGDSEESEEILSVMLDECLEKLRNNRIKFVSTRINSDNIPALHAFESRGFKYYETIIWLVSSCKNVESRGEHNVRLMTENDLERVLHIASANTFQRSHYHCDNRFDTQKVNLMHEKWLETAWNNQDPIAVIESAGQIRGFFAFTFDRELSEATGYSYARMRNLALDKKMRGKNLGEKLFTGTITLMKDMGAEYIDSGYSSKNHVSAKLHARHSFSSVYDEVTFHLWL